MNKTFLAGKNLDKAAEVLDRNDLARVDPVGLDLLGQGLDLCLGSLGTVHVGTPDRHDSIVLDLDGRPGLFLDALDHLASRSNDQADLLRIDTDLDNPRGIGGDIGARLIERLEHLLEDVNPSRLRLLQGLAQELLANPGDLDVHLKGRNPELGSSNLEIHVTVVILAAEDVAEDRDVVAILDQPHRNTCNRLANLDSGVHEPKNSTANRCH